MKHLDLEATKEKIGDKKFETVQESVDFLKD